MCQLLGSTNKAEVLENMESFRIAWEYQFDGAEMSHSDTVRYSSDVPHVRVNRSIKPTAYLARLPRKTVKNRGAFTHACWCCHRTL